MHDPILKGDWVPGPDIPTLEPGEVHLWRVDLDADAGRIDAAEGVLNDEERTRAHRFRNATIGRRYAASHISLRRCLGRYLNTPPEDIAFRVNAHGKPRIAGADRNAAIEFNLAHSANRALIAITSGRTVGIDLERIRANVDADLIARRQFAPQDRQRIEALPETDRRAAFFACWVRKEAYIKARGEAIALGLDRFEVGFGPECPAEILRSDAGPGERARWAVLPLDLGKGWAAACVVERPLRNVRCWTGEFV